MEDLLVEAAYSQKRMAHRKSDRKKRQIFKASNGLVVIPQIGKLQQANIYPWDSLGEIIENCSHTL